MDLPVYRSTQTYTFETYIDSMGGLKMYQVTDSTGMLVAVLTEEQFNQNYELIQ